MLSERTLMQLLENTLPLSDLGIVPREVLMGYVRHALFLREHSSYSKDIDEELFLHFVFYPRINTEDLVDCRRFFYDKLQEQIGGLSDREAVLTINRWCCAHMTYQSADDRTENPLTAYLSGTGRCGEESTFLVTALRSVGIPARQVYVPWWVHCDDNHAWVEAYVEGRWQYLGACEPEPILNRGWFTDASSRAPLAVYRTFFPYEKGETLGEACIGSLGCARIRNVTHHYAPVRPLTIHVKDTQWKPLAGASVHVDVLNMAAYRSLLAAKTDETGTYTVSLGKTGYHVEAVLGDLYGETEVDLAQEMATDMDEIEVTITLAPVTEAEQIYEADYMPPAVDPRSRTKLSPDQQEENRKLLSACSKHRKARIASFYLPAYDDLPEEWQEILKLAGGNAPVIYRFYQETESEDHSLALALLKTLSKKDYKDITYELLERFWLPVKSACSAAGKRDFVRASGEPDETLFAALYSPRVEYEFLGDWRTAVDYGFSKEEKNAFAADPSAFMTYIREHFSNPNEGRHYPMLPITPCGALKMGYCDEKGRKLLFVAGLRSFGVPARLDPVTGEAEFYNGTSWEKPKNRIDGGRNSQDALGNRAELKLLTEEGDVFRSESNFTLSVWKGRGYEILQVGEVSGSKVLTAAPGCYRLITTNRLPNGKQLARICRFSVKEGEKKMVKLSLRQAKPQELLSDYCLEEVLLKDAHGTVVSSRELVGNKTLLAWLEVSKEPTEHLLNELWEARETLQKKMADGMRILFVLRSPADLADKTLQKTLAALPDCRCYYEDFKGQAFGLARSLFLEPGVWPLAVLANKEHRGLYGVCGYQVGTVSLVLKIADA